jgi:hypothetical protein
MPQLDIDALRQAVAAGDYRITIHAKDQLAKRTVMVTEAKRVVTDGAIIERHLDDYPYPKALFMSYVRGEPLYASCAFDGTHAYIITVHWYDPEKWVDPWTRRK